jgi:DNA modification methylase
MRSSLPSRHDNIRLHVEYVPLSSLRSTFRQTKRHGARQIKRLAHAMNRVGFAQPITVTDDLDVVSGHARVEAATLIGLSEVPIIRMAHLSRDELRLLAIFDNKVATEGTIDLNEVLLELDDVAMQTPDLMLTDSGFEVGEIDALRGLTRTNELDDLDDDPEPSAIVVTRVGDLWRLGDHRLLCADATDPAAVQNLMAGSSARAIVSDAPYNLKIPGVVSGKGRKQHQDFVMASGEMERGQFVSFLGSFFSAAKPHLIDGALSLVFMDWRHIGELLAAAEAAEMSYRQLLVWAKSNPAMGGGWRNAHELIGVFKTGEAPHVDNVQLGRFGRNRSNVLHYPGANVLTKGRRKALELHPTVKPVALIADLILDVTEPGDIVLDCFGGSGTTLMAANAVDRKACLNELDPQYVDVTLARWLKRTGEQPILDETGQTFAEVSEARLAAVEETIDGE